MTAAFGAGLVPSAEAASPSDFSRLRQCESGGDYAINTGNGFYGAYQFDQRTWRGLGYAGVPSNAAPATQDRAAADLFASRGWEPWPACARKLSLSRSNDSSARASRGRFTIIAKSRSAPTPLVPTGFAPTRVAATAPAFDGQVLTTADVGTNRADVRAWQRRMKARGWELTIDGRFGPKSAQVAARFAAEKRLSTPLGTVDRLLWTSAWELPVT